MRLRRFLLCFAVLAGALFLISLTPGLHQLIGGELPEPVELPPLRIQEAAWLPAGSETTCAAQREAFASHGGEGRGVLRSIEKPMAAIRPVLRDANGNALESDVYRKAVYQAFALGDAMG